MPSLEIVKGRSVFEELGDEWRALVVEDPLATPFQTFEWQRIWFEHYGLGKEPWAVCVREGRDLVGLLTLVRFRGAWTVLRSLGIGPSDYLHPLALTERAREELRGFIEGFCEADLLDLHQIRETNPVLEGLEPGMEQAHCLVLDLPSSYESFVAGLGKSLRYDVRKLDRSLIEPQKAIVERVTAERLQAGFDAFLEQHKARWHSRRLPGAFIGRGTRFHREWIELAHRNDWLRLRLLRVEGKIIGAIYAMAFNQTVYYYQAGFDPEMKAFSPGNLLVAQTIKEAIEEGRSQFDFMRGDEAYKRRWKPQHAWSNRRLMVSKGSLAGVAGMRWNQEGHRLEKKIRSQLEGPGGQGETR
jgi:CelD/BcsL family acetyltransferase involved in cellulose biosynthesis